MDLLYQVLLNFYYVVAAIFAQPKLDLDSLYLIIQVICPSLVLSLTGVLVVWLERWQPFFATRAFRSKLGNEVVVSIGLL